MRKNYLKQQGGFTLLELLIVIVIVGILAIMVVPSILNAPKKNRDAQRKIDLSTVHIGLEEYYTSYSAYPEQLDKLTAGDPPIIKSVPKDPLNTRAHRYIYEVAEDKNSYSLKVCLESKKDTDQYTVTDTNCADSKRGYQLVNNN